MDIDAISARLVSELGSKQSILVAIDGAGGSGKSTVARKLCASCGLISVVYGDDFYAPMDEDERAKLSAEEGYRGYFDWMRMRDEVLVPLSNDQRARYRRYQWESNHLGEWVTQRPEGIVLIEGVYSHRPELRRFYDFSVFVDTPRAECLNRLCIRGGNSYDSIRRWRAAEDYYLAHIDPASSVSLVVPGSAYE